MMQRSVSGSTVLYGLEGEAGFENVAITSTDEVLAKALCGGTITSAR